VTNQSRIDSEKIADPQQRGDFGKLARGFNGGVVGVADAEFFFIRIVEFLSRTEFFFTILSNGFTG
jgi:hypothetical protein